MRASYDVVIPTFGERRRALRATVEACLAQRLPPQTVWVVDDGSPEPIRRDDLPSGSTVRLLRLDVNSGISAARMKAIGQSRTPLVACVNVDVLLHPQWAETLVAYASARPDVGAVFGRLIPIHADHVLSRWRMRFHEERYDVPAGPAPFAPGHAVLFRRSSLDAVGGYDLRRRRILEDSDICERMRAAGYDTHYVPGSAATSIQTDRLVYLGYKQLLRDGFDPAFPFASSELPRKAIDGALKRLRRNAREGYLPFLPVDVAICVLELIHYARHRRQPLPAGYSRERLTSPSRTSL